MTNALTINKTPKTFKSEIIAAMMEPSEFNEFVTDYYRKMAEMKNSKLPKYLRDSKNHEKANQYLVAQLSAIEFLIEIGQKRSNSDTGNERRANQYAAQILRHFSKK